MLNYELKLKVLRCKGTKAQRNRAKRSGEKKYAVCSHQLAEKKKGRGAK